MKVCAAVSAVGVVLVPLLATPCRAGPQVPEPETRLIPGGFAEGRYRAAIEIRLPEPWHTYWRNPGDSGIPPTFATEGSRNLSVFTPLFPAPRRFFDGYGTTIVYPGGVVLPVELVPAEPGAPVDLRLTLDFGYCAEICVPGHAAFEATFTPDEAPSAADAAAVAAALATVPVPEAAAGPDAPRIVSVERHGETAKTATLSIVVAAPGEVDLFAEPPEGWYLAVPERTRQDEGRSVFTLPLDGAAADASLAGARFRFTAVGTTGSVEAERTLD